MKKQKSIVFPNGKDFAFTIFDDTDGATVENIRQIYELLVELGIFTTKSVWVFPSKSTKADTLEEPDYLNFINWLHSKGFEIALHDVSGTSNKREKVISGIENFYKLLGFYPSSQANHLKNYDNLYWGSKRLNSSLLRLLLRLSKYDVKSEGHIKNSPYFWGDLCLKHIHYVRNFTFREINLLKINPTLPYHNPSKPFVPFWFSSSDGRDVEMFNKLLSSKNQERLEKERGVCIVYTHFASGFVKNGKVNPKTKKLLEELAKRNGWFCPVTRLLDHLKKQRNNVVIPKFELRKMEWRWFLEKTLEKI